MRALSKASVFPTLMVASALTAFLLPAAWTDWLRALFQPLAFLQMPVHALGRSVSAGLERSSVEALSPEQARDLRQENAALQRQVLQQRARLEAIESQLRTVSGLAEQSGESHVRIVIAPVVQHELTSIRSTLRIALSEAQAEQVLVGQWVLAPAEIAPHWDSDAVVADLRDRAWVVGRISEVRPRLATVQLTTDPRFRTEVLAARVQENGQWQLAPESCLLVGQGRGRMRLSSAAKCPECGAARAYADQMAITQAMRDYAQEGYRIVVLPAPLRRGGPASAARSGGLVIGRLLEGRARDDSPQHFDLTVEPCGRADRLSLVYVQCSRQ